MALLCLRLLLLPASRSRRALNMSEMDESFTSDISQVVIVTSTPKRCRNPNFQNRSSPFKKPMKATGKGKGAVVGKCDRCSKEYRSLRYFKSHVRARVLQESFARCPNGPEFLGKALNIHMSVMEEMVSLPCYGRQGEMFGHLVVAVVEKEDSPDLSNFIYKVCSSFVDVIEKKSFVVPSSLLSVFTKRTESVRSDIVLRMELLLLLQKVVICEERVIQCFVSEYVQRFGEQLFMCIASSIKNDKNLTQMQNPQLIDQEDRQNAHYIGGSIIRGFIAMGKKSTKSDKWKRISCTLQRRLLESEDSAPASQVDRKWTQTRDRGGLKYVNASCLEFLLAIAEIIAFKGIYDRGINYDAVLQEIYCTNVVAMWDNMLAGDLPETSSLSLLHGIVRSFCQTFGAGLRAKRRNALREKPEASIPLRHKLAPH